jgi:S-adenosyl methyltransferase
VSDEAPEANDLPVGNNVDDESPAFKTSISHHARIYDYMLGGKDHFAADRAHADALIAADPSILTSARANRAFLGRAVRYLAADANIDQFLDIGTGIPSPGNTHEVAQRVRPDAKIVYVDNDPVVLAHARALLTSELTATDYIDADLRNPEAILEQAAKTLDLTRPVGVLMLAILHAIGNEDDPHRIVATIMNAMPPGSYLAITHVASDLVDPKTEATAIGLALQKSAHQYTYRDRVEVGRFFDGLELVEPGIVPLAEWRPEPQTLAASTVGWAGVARKP